MKRAAVVCIFMLLGAGALCAQSAPKSQTQTNFVIVVPNIEACPAIMRARHTDSLYAREWVNGRPRRESSGMRLEVTLTGGRAAQIAKATVTVHGLNGTRQVFKTAGAPGSGNIEKTMDVEFAAGANGSAETTLVLAGFSSVISIALDQVTYRDGSTWTSAARGACQVAPDPFMLVSGQLARAPAQGK